MWLSSLKNCQVFYKDQIVSFNQIILQEMMYMKSEADSWFKKLGAQN